MNVCLVFWLKMVNINVPKIEFQCCILVLRKKPNLWLIFCNLFSEYGLPFGLFPLGKKHIKRFIYQIWLKLDVQLLI